MSVNIKVEKKHLYLLSAIIIFLVGVGLVVGLNSGNYLVHGHTTDEIQGGGGSGGVSLGAWETKTSQTVYTAATDGFVVAYSTRPGNPGLEQMSIWIESPVGTVRTQQKNDNSGNNQYLGISSPVKKGDTWKVDVSGYQPGVGQDYVYWIPLVGGGGSGGGTVSLFDEAHEVVLYTSTTCADGTNGKWITYDVSSYVPSTAKKAILRTYCGENIMSLRPLGSSLTPDNVDTVACQAGNNANNQIFFFVNLNSDKKFEAYNTGTNCNTRLAKITLIGYG